MERSNEDRRLSSPSSQEGISTNPPGDGLPVNSTSNSNPPPFIVPPPAASRAAFMCDDDDEEEEDPQPVQPQFR